jgi:hypothetical protein
MAEITTPQDVPQYPPAVWKPREWRRRMRDHWALWLVLIAGLATLCMVIPAVLVLVHGKESGGEWEGVADAFMCAMRDGEVDQGFAMWATGPETRAIRPQLQDMVTSSQYVLFDGYERLEMTSWNRTIGTGGNFVTLEGVVDYADDSEGTFTFILVRENESWKVYSFYVTVPWEKIDAFTNAK